VLTALFIGLLFGFFGSMPLAGPVALLVFSRCLDGRSREALAVGIGSALAEGGFACLTFWGIASLVAEHEVMLSICRGIGAVILLSLGVACFRKRAQAVKAESPPSDRGSVVLGFLLTALNPTLVATWAAATTTLFSLDIVSAHPSHALLFAAGVVAGDVLWYMLLVLLADKWQRGLGERTVHLALKACGVLLLVFGASFAYLFAAGLAMAR
jgi:threonine/homoserine/homoserine lactone efflux protein